jgi:hypothetical protein
MTTPEHLERIRRLIAAQIRRMDELVPFRRVMVQFERIERERKANRPRRLEEEK